MPMLYFRYYVLIARATLIQLIFFSSSPRATSTHLSLPYELNIPLIAIAVIGAGSISTSNKKAFIFKSLHSF
ncbi:MAG TPA: hypothetical protein EYH00_05560 [Archaeoglobus profundus]|nr:hypothetical protein [Archaeoglobus profundus]